MFLAIDSTRDSCPHTIDQTSGVLLSSTTVISFLLDYHVYERLGSYDVRISRCNIGICLALGQKSVHYLLHKLIEVCELDMDRVEIDYLRSNT